LKRLQDLSLTDIAGIESPVVIVPFGSTEQHCSAPLGTDYIIADALAEQVCDRIEEYGLNCILAHGLPYGFSPEWGGCPGTISLRLETIVSIVKDILDSLDAMKPGLIVFLNGHGGNSTPLEAAVREWVSTRNPGYPVLVVDYWRVTGLKLGHCDPVEEELLSQVLDKPVKCRCQEMLTIESKGISGLTIPQPACNVGALHAKQQASKPGIDEIADVLARSIIERSRTPGF